MEGIQIKVKALEGQLQKSDVQLFLEIAIVFFSIHSLE